MVETKITFAEVEQKRRVFAAAVKTFTAQKGRYHDRAQDLPPEKVHGCEVLANRYELLDRLPKGGTYAEIGVDRGDFSAEILRRCQPDMLHLFDIDLGRLNNADILKRLADGNGVRTHAGDSSSNLSRMPDGTFDVIYIDGDHEYEGVMRDIEAALPKLSAQGILVFNDYSVWSPTTMMRCGVARAVHELLHSHPWRMRYLALQSMLYNDVMLVRM